MVGRSLGALGSSLVSCCDRGVKTCEKSNNNKTRYARSCQIHVSVLSLVRYGTYGPDTTAYYRVALLSLAGREPFSVRTLKRRKVLRYGGPRSQYLLPKQESLSKTSKQSKTCLTSCEVCDVLTPDVKTGSSWGMGNGEW